MLCNNALLIEKNHENLKHTQHKLTAKSCTMLDKEKAGYYRLYRV